MEGSGRRRPARRGEGAALRAEIIKAASRELARTGDAAVITLRGVARAVGIATTSIYLHFASVEELVNLVKQERFEQFSAILREAADAAGPDPVARIVARSRAYVTFWRERPGEYAVMFAVRLTPPSGPLRGLDVISELADDVAAVWGQAETSEEARLCAFHLWTSLHGMLSLRMLRPHLPWPDLELEVADLRGRLLGQVRAPDPLRAPDPHGAGS